MIEFQYFEGCPNADITLKNLREVLNEESINQDLHIVRIENEDEAELYNFQGSPSVILDGKDIYSKISPTSYNYSCRIYIFDGLQTGILSKTYIKKHCWKCCPNNKHILQFRNYLL